MTDFNYRENNRTKRSDGRIWTGVFILLIGLASLMKATLTGLPDWVFSWKMLLIAVGIFIGFRSNFRDHSWLVPVLVGSVFILNDINPDFALRRYLWPIAIIILGLFIIVRPRSRKKYWGEEGTTATSGGTEYNREDFVDSTNIFGGSKKNVISKNFKGGDIVSIFGGTELDLSQADFKGTAILDVTTIFGGAKLIVPSNWELSTEAVTILGGIDDKRKMQVIQEKPDKTLVLKGTVLFGGIEIKSY
jgi:predicted membrane protein